MDRLKIAYVLAAQGIPYLGPSGSSAHARGLALALGRRHDVRVYAALLEDARGRHGVAPDPWFVGGVPGWPSWLRRFREMREVWAARRLSDRIAVDAAAGWRPDVVIERHSLFSDAGWRASERTGARHVLEVNAPPVMERERFEELLRPRWAARWERVVLRAAPEICAVSRWLVDWLAEEIGARGARWVPNGTSLPVGERARGRARWDLAPDDRVVGFVGSHKPWHGHERVAEVARALGAKALLVGAGAGAADGARATGHLDGQELADAVAAFDVALAPYPADAPPWFCPLKLLDYRSQGTPAVATDIGDCAAILASADADGRVPAVAQTTTGTRRLAGGWVVQPDKPGELIDAAREALDAPRPAPWKRGWDVVADEMLAPGAPA